MDQTEFNEIIEELHRRVADGDVQCMHWLGDMYYQGLSGTDENSSAAFPYWKMAADHGDDEIAGKVGVCLVSGIGCEEDREAGFQYLLRSANIGNARAQHLVGTCLLDGVGISADRETGLHYLRLSAMQNFPPAQMDLCRILTDSNDSDFDEAVHWMCCAHLNGVEEASRGIEVLLNSPENAKAVRQRIQSIQRNGINPAKSSGQRKTSFLGRIFGR